MLTKEQRDKSRHRSDVRKARERKLVDEAFGFLDDDGLVAYLKQRPNPDAPLDENGDYVKGFEFMYGYIEWCDETRKHAKQVRAAKAILMLNAEYIRTHCL